MRFFLSIATIVALVLASAYGNKVSVMWEKGKGRICDEPNPPPFVRVRAVTVEYAVVMCVLLYCVVLGGGWYLLFLGVGSSGENSDGKAGLYFFSLVFSFAPVFMICMNHTTCVISLSLDEFVETL